MHHTESTCISSPHQVQSRFSHLHNFNSYPLTSHRNSSRFDIKEIKSIAFSHKFINKFLPNSYVPWLFFIPWNLFIWGFTNYYKMENFVQVNRRVLCILNVVQKENKEFFLCFNINNSVKNVLYNIKHQWFRYVSIECECVCVSACVYRIGCYWAFTKMKTWFKVLV